MNVDVVLLPAHLTPGQAEGKAVAVFDVLRATTSIAAALASGITAIRVFPTLEEARSAADFIKPRPLLSGEKFGKAPPGFDLGNSPCQFTRDHFGREMILSTTNGTKAMSAVKNAGIIFPAALVNATAVAKALAHTDRDILLLCAGTDGQIAMEDVIGTGAVASWLLKQPRYMLHGKKVRLSGDATVLAQRLFLGCLKDLKAALCETNGGKHVISGGFEADIDFAARLDSLDVVGTADPQTLIIRPSLKSNLG